MTCQLLQSQRTTTTIATIAIIVENINCEQIKGIEPSSSVWQTDALAVVLYLQLYRELGSNQRPSAYEAPTLPTELSRQFWLRELDSNQRLLGLCTQRTNQLSYLAHLYIEVDILYKCWLRE